MGHSLKESRTKQVIKSVASNMTGTARLVSDVVDARFIDTIGWTAKWTGTPNGAFTMEVSNDYLPGNTPLDPVQNAGTWATVTPSTAITGGGAAGNMAWSVQVPFAFARLVWTNTSSTGACAAQYTGKSAG